MQEIVYSNFNKGLDTGSDDAKLQDGAYPFLSLGRTRFNNVRPVKLPTQIIKGISGNNFQGLYGFDNYLLLFTDGKCFYKDISQEPSNFKKLIGFQLDADVEKIYAEAVPGSLVNYARQSIDGNASSSINFTSKIAESPASVVITDGVNQPIIIFADGTFRSTKTYEEWNNTTDSGREYVPVGILPLYVSPTLYMVARGSDGRYTQIVRSVSGRPLDFMVNINKLGDKQGTEKEGGALSVATGVSFGEITAINKTPSLNNSLLVSTLNATYILEPDYTQPIFGEPRYNSRQLINTGAINEECVTEVLGDTVFIDQNSIRSFNSIANSTDLGSNSVFSIAVQQFLDEEVLTQNVACLTTFNNYVLFALTTTSGAAVLVYDLNLGKFVSIDQYPEVTQIKQFAQVKVAGDKELYFITTDNKLFKAFSGNTSTMRLLLPGSITMSGGHLIRAQIGLSNIKSSGNIQVTVYTDKKRTGEIGRKVESTFVSRTPISQPYTPQESDADATFTFDLSKIAFDGLRHNLYVETDIDCEITYVKAVMKETNQRVNTKEQSRLFNISPIDTTADKKTFTFFADNGALTDATIAISRLVKERKPDLIIGGGDHRYDGVGSFTDNFLSLFEEYWKRNRIYLALGNHDIDGDNGIEIIQKLLYPNTSRYFVKELDADTDIYIINSGYNSLGQLIEPHGNTIDSTQYKYIRDLIRGRGKKINIAVFHFPPYTNSAAYNPGYGAMRWDFKSLGFDLVLNGHSHNVERFYIDNLTYLVNGAGGHSLRPFSSITNVAGSQFQYNADYCYSLITKDKFNLLVQTFNTSDDLVDEALIQV